MNEAAFFDLDKTIIAKSSTLAFTRPMFKAGLLSGSTLAKAGVAQAYYQAFGADHDQLERVKEELSGLVEGWSREEVEGVVEETVDEVITPLVYAEALAIIDQHKRDGRKVVVISASPEEIVRPLCRYLGIEDVIATRSAVDEEGNYTGEFESAVTLRDKLPSAAAAGAGAAVATGVAAVLAYWALKGRKT